NSCLCCFLEDAVEHGNQFVQNLAILTKCHPDAPCVPTNLAPFKTEGGKNFLPDGQNAKDILIPSDNTASTFWITNPDNTYRDNVAAGSDATGFWFALPEHPTGKFEGTEISKQTWPRRTRVREFKGNTAHSNFDSFLFDRGPRPDGHFAVGGHISLANPADANSPQAESVIEDFTGYKNRNGGIWTRGEMHTFKNLKLADNAIGYTHASGNFGRSAFTSRVVDSLFVGETENIGNPRTPPVTSLAAALLTALVAEPASRPAGKQQPCCTSKSPRLTAGGFFSGCRVAHAINSRNRPSKYHGSLTAAWHSASSCSRAVTSRNKD